MENTNEELPKGVTRQADGTLRVALDYPLNDGKRETAAVFVRRPNVRTVRAMGDYAGDEMGAGVELVAGTTGLDRDDIEAMDAIDFKRVLEVATLPLLRGLPTGPKQSESSPTDSTSSPASSTE